MEQGPTSTPPWLFAVEFSDKDRSLADLMSAAHAYFRESRSAHEMVLESPARVVVRFADLRAAEMFYFRFSGRFVRLPADPPTPPTDAR